MEDNKDLATDAQEDDPFKNMRDSKPWLDDIAEADRVMNTWNERCDNIEKLYADLNMHAREGKQREMQIFWANMEVMKPSIYARPPVPVVGARFKDRKPLIRHASEILERSLNTSFDREDIHGTMKLIRDDLALNSRGVVWPRLENKQDLENVLYDHVDRKDFKHGPARKWSEVPWVSRTSRNTKEEIEARFGEGGANLTQINYQRTDEGSNEDEKQGIKKAEVHEIWSKSKGLVVWVSPGVEQVLDIREPFLDLEGFFPCPKPAYGTVQKGTLIPVPDMLYYKDQLEEINELTGRMSALAESLRMKGFYAAGDEDISTAIETAMKKTDDNAILIPVPSTAALGPGAGGIKDAIVWLPVREVAEVIVQLVALRKQLIEDVYQITGISDIMRGATDANETLGAQQLKSQYGSIRIKDKQEEIVRIARDSARIAGEIMAENFSPQTLMMMSQYDEVPTRQAVQQQIQGIQGQIMQAAQDPANREAAMRDPKVMEQAKQALAQAQNQIKELQSQVTLDDVLEFLRNQRMRPFVMEIETDSTIQPDENAAKQRTTEFMGALATALSQLAPMIQAQPKTATFAGEVLKFAVSPFRAGRELDAAIDELVEQMKEQSAQPQQDPKAEAAKAQAEAKMQDTQLKIQEGQLRMQEAQQNLITETQQAQADLEKTNAEVTKIYAEIQKLRQEPAQTVQ